MIELTTDPQTISFQKGNNISLPLLKNEIDRRILKITCMVNHLSMKGIKRSRKSSRRSHSKSNKQIQTQEINQRNELEDYIADSRVLVASKSVNILDVNHQFPQKKDSDSPYEQYLNKNHRKQKETTNKKERSKKTDSKSYLKENFDSHLIPMIESNGFTFREVRAEESSEGSTDKKNIQDSQDDKIFESVDFGLHISNVQMCCSIAQQQQQAQNDKFKTANNNRQSSKNEVLMVSSFLELQNSQVTKNENSMRRTGPRKIRLGNREVVLPVPERRIIVGDECRLKMQEEVEVLYSKKRKEASDNKLRVNVLKKIEEKYGEEYVS